MAEPVTLQTLLTYLTLISVPVGVFYHIMTLRNTRKNQELQLETRQAQLYMGLINTLRSPEFRRQWHIAEAASWEDYDDFSTKYSAENNPEVLSAFTSVWAFFESVGTLVKKGLIDLGLVDGFLAGSLVGAWRWFEPLLIGDRDHFGANLWADFEYVYDEIMKRGDYRISDT
jgi:hypothetical protein